MRRFGIALLWAIGGYLLTAIAGHFLIGQLSSNQHDRSLEAAMTSAFVLGPTGAAIAFIIGFVRTAPRGGERP